MDIAISQAERHDPEIRSFLKRATSKIREAEQCCEEGAPVMALQSLATSIGSLCQVIRCLNYEGGEGAPYPKVESCVKYMVAMSFTREALRSILLARKHLEAVEVTKDAHRVNLLLADAISSLTSQQHVILDELYAEQLASHKRSIFGRR